jgi:hypothetical protein
MNNRDEESSMIIEHMQFPKRLVCKVPIELEGAHTSRWLALIWTCVELQKATRFGRAIDTMNECR